MENFKYLFILIGITFFINQSAYAQVTITNEDGDKIIIMPDGTWKYADKDKEKERIKLEKIKGKKEKNKPSDIFNDPKNPEKTNEANKVKLTRAAKRRVKAEKKRQKLARKEAKKEGLDIPKSKKKGSKKLKIPTITLFNKKAERNKDKVTKDSTDKNPKKVDKPKKVKTENADKPKKVKTENADKPKKVKDGSISKSKVEKPKVKKPKTPKNKNGATNTLKPLKDFSISEAPLECKYAVNEIDPFTGSRKVATQESFFFGFTNEELLRFMQGKHFIECHASINQVGNAKLLKMKLIVDSPYAQKEYGGIQENGKIMIRLINGKVITLTSNEADGGTLNSKEGKTTFSAYYMINEKKAKALQKSEINQIRFYWANGFEDYEIYEIDFLKKHLQCLENAVK